MPETEPEQFETLDAAVNPLAASTGLDLPLWTQNGSYGAIVDRLAIETLVTAGVKGTAHLAVTPRAAGANLSVDVSTGVCAITGNDAAGQGRYLCRSNAVNNLPINGPPTAGLSRIDRVIARVYDTAVIGGSTNGWVLDVVAGTPAASPAAPALPPSSLSLALVTVPSGLAAVVAGNIADDRTYWTGPGGASGNYTPTLSTNGTTQPVVGNAPTFLGRWLLVAPKLVYVQFSLYLGTTSNMGNGDLWIGVPPQFPMATLGGDRQMGHVALYTGANGDGYWYFGHLRDNANAGVVPWVPYSSASSRMMACRNADATNTAGTGYPQIAGKFTLPGGAGTTCSIMGNLLYETT